MTIKPWIIKGGGDLFISPKVRSKLLTDLVRFRRNHPTLFVHGAGPQIGKELRKNKIPFRYYNGRRVTTPAIMDVVEKILGGDVNKLLSAELLMRGIPSIGISCRDGGIIIGRPVPHLGRAGTPWKVNPKLLHVLLEANVLPVLSSVASDSRGAPLNINADDVASALAGKMKAKGLIFLTDVDGIFNQHRRRFPSLHKAQIQDLLKKGIIKGGMIPKVQSALQALQNGVAQVYIVNGTKGIHLKKGTKITRS